MSRRVLRSTPGPPLFFFMSASSLQAGVDVDRVHHDLKDAVEAIDGKLPSEHGHGMEYVAPDDTKRRWQAQSCPKTRCAPVPAAADAKFLA